MSVYIDCMNAKFRNMTMCHMLADTKEELLAMCKMIGVQNKWIQDEGEYSEHFDICLTKKAKALKCGAIEIGNSEMGRYIQARRKGEKYTPKPANETLNL